MTTRGKQRRMQHRRYAQIELRPRIALAPDVEVPADTFGALAHAVQPKMSLRRLTLDHALVDTAAVVCDTETKLTLVEANLHPDTARLRMVKRVAQGLDGNPVDLELHDWPQRLRCALGVDLDARRHLLSDASSVPIFLMASTRSLVSTAAERNPCTASRACVVASVA